MAGALRGRAAAALAALAGGAGFAYWDATDKRGGVGVTRAAAATATAALAVADTSGLSAGSRRTRPVPGGATRRSRALRRAASHPVRAQRRSVRQGWSVHIHRQRHARPVSAALEAAGFRRPLDWEDVRDVVVAELGAGAMANLVPGDVPGDATVVLGDVAPRHSKSFASFDREPSRRRRWRRCTGR